MSLFLPARQPERLLEATPYNPTGFVDPDDHQYRIIGTAPRDLLGNSLRKAQEMSVSMYRTNPLANRIIKVYTTFMAGEGFAVSCDNPDVQTVAEEFWSAERNRLDQNHRGLARDHLLFGETIAPVASDGEGTGNTTIGYIDPSRIEWIERSSHSDLILEAVHLRQDYYTGKDTPPLKVVRTQADPTEPEAGLMMGDVFAWLNDRIGAASRGTPFLLPVLDWLEAYDQVLWEQLERIKAVRAFFWDVEVAGGSAEIAAAQTAWGITPPRSGSVRFRNPSIKVSAESPDLKTDQDAVAARHIIRHIATGAGLAPHWLGDPEDANRSTAVQMDKPVHRALVDAQATWKTHMEDAIRYAVDRKVAERMLARIVERHDESNRPTGDMVPARSTVEVIVPSVTDDDLTAAAGAIAQVATAFVALDTIGAIDADTIRRVVKQLLPALGVPADELPEDDEDATAEETMRQDIEVLESWERRARRGKLDRLLEQMAEIDDIRIAG